MGTGPGSKDRTVQATAYASHVSNVIVIPFVLAFNLRQNTQVKSVIVSVVRLGVGSFKPEVL